MDITAERSHKGTPSEPLSARDEWRRGWKLVVSSAIGMTLTSFPVTAVGVYMSAFQQEFSWPRSGIAAAVTIITFFAAVTAPLMGWIVERIGLRRVAVIGTLTAPIAFGLLAAQPGPILIYWLSYSLIAAAHAFSSAYIWTMGVAQSFARARGLAIAIVLMGSSIIGALYPAIATLAMEKIGWRMTIVATAAIALLITSSMVLLWFRLPSVAGPTRESPQDRPGVSLRTALRSHEMWRLLAAVLLGCGALLAMIMHCMPLVTSRGYTALEASSAMFALGLSAILGKLVVGYLIDRANVARLAALLMVIALAPAVLLQFEVAGQWWWPPLVGGLLGAAASSEIDILANLVARFWGTAHFPKIYGVVFGTFQLALGTGPILLGLAFDLTGSYDMALKIMVPMFLASALLFATLAPAQPPIRRLKLPE